MFEKRRIKLHHLHGSLSSFKDIHTGKTFKITTEGLRTNNIYNIFDLNITPSIVTGGGKSAKIREMPLNFHYNIFRRKLSSEAELCEELYIIGYSIRDDHINNSIIEYLKLERQREYEKPLKRLLIVDFKSTREEKEKFIGDVNSALKLEPRMKKRFEYE